MYGVLAGLRVVEGSSFVASPLCGMYLAQMGADVIRFDAIGGGPDYHRWPLAPAGGSFYWEGLNKGKKSIAIDLSRPEGRELAVQLATAPGESAGLFVTNYPVDGFLAHEKLVALRADLISVRIMGQADGKPALDYTVNSAVGLPFMTGPPELGDAPVNHVLPAWDLLTGAYAAFALLAVERQRRQTGKGQEVRIPLSDIAVTSVANLGQVAEVLTAQANRPRLGNAVFGAFGRDYLTKDGQRLMIMALTPRQWTGLVKVLALGEQIAAIERRLEVSFARDEGLRFQHRAELMLLVEKAVASRSYDDLRAAFDAHDVCWGPYRTLLETASAEDGWVKDNPVFTVIDNPSGHSYPVPGSAATLPGKSRGTPIRAPQLGEHTDEILGEILGFSAGTIGRLHDQGIVASAPSDLQIKC
jgi:2-methylfumaryl-CoA isomerase